MIRLGKMGRGGPAALRRGGASSTSGTLVRVRSGLGRTLEARQVFSVAKPPAGARSVLCREAPFSTVSLGQQAQQGMARHAAFGNGTSAVGGTIWGTLREAMVRQRRVPLLNTTTNLSNQCGHLSFVILALAYLETDVLALR